VGGIVIFVSTKHGTIKIELSDPTAQVEITVDGDTVSVDGLDEPLKLKVGPHDLTITGANFETVTRTFTVKKGNNPLLRVELKPKQVARGSGKPPDGKRLATGGRDFVVKVWDIAEKKVALSLSVREDKKAFLPAIHCLTFSPDGRSLFAGSLDSNLWNAATGELLWKKRGHVFGTFNAPFSPDGKTLATVGSEGDLNLAFLVDPADGRVLRPFTGPPQGRKGAEDVSFDPLGRFLAAAGPDNQVRLWDVKNWKEL
jgi:hypothetical protein